MHDVVAGENKYKLTAYQFCNSKGDVQKGTIMYFEFIDQLSVDEYKISGLCQKCQDQVFSPYEEDPYFDPKEDQAF